MTWSNQHKAKFLPTSSFGSIGNLLPLSGTLLRLNPRPLLGHRQPAKSHTSTKAQIGSSQLFKCPSFYAHLPWLILHFVFFIKETNKVGFVFDPPESWSAPKATVTRKILKASSANFFELQVILEKNGAWG